MIAGSGGEPVGMGYGRSQADDDGIAYRPTDT